MGTVLRKDPKREKLLVEKIIMHENFQDSSVLQGVHSQMPNDIALLQLKKDIVYGPNVQPADIGNAALDYTGDTKFTVLGYGRVNVKTLATKKKQFFIHEQTIFFYYDFSQLTAVPTWLQEIQLNAVPLLDCQKRWQGRAILDNTKICTFGGSGRGICAVII